MRELRTCRSSANTLLHLQPASRSTRPSPASRVRPASSADSSPLVPGLLTFRHSTQAATAGVARWSGDCPWELLAASIPAALSDAAGSTGRATPLPAKAKPNVPFCPASGLTRHLAPLPGVTTCSSQQRYSSYHRRLCLGTVKGQRGGPLCLCTSFVLAP